MVAKTLICADRFLTGLCIVPSNRPYAHSEYMGLCRPRGGAFMLLI